ncbi:MAG: DMT family transporter [Candidatus Aenigmatarchaeota archaeon]
MKKETLGTLLAIMTAFVSGIAIPINKIFVVDLDPTVFTAIRALIIGVIFFILASFQSKFDYQKFKKVPWKYLLAIGIIGGSFAFLMFFTGLKLTTGGRAAFLHKTLPIYIAVFAFIFLKEKVSLKQVYALAVMFIGTILLFSAKISPSEFWLNPSLGDMLVIGATILWAIENTIARKAMIKGESNLVVSFARMFFGAIILFAVLILQYKLGLLLALTMQQMINLCISVAILFGYIFFWYWSIKLINVSKASTLLLLAPVISLIIGVIVFGEPTPFLQLFGSALILAGAYVVVRIKSEFTTGV